MKKVLPLLIIMCSVTLFGFTYKEGISKCYISFNKATGFKKARPERLPETSDKSRILNTANGDVTLTIVDGYRVLYLNKKKVPFVNMKVELSDPANYKADQQNILENLKYLNAGSTGMESKDLIQLDYNGFKVYGLSRASIESGSTLGTFVMFPGNNTIVYLYFNNLNPELSNFTSIEDYKAQRNTFIGEYTAYLKNCK